MFSSTVCNCEVTTGSRFSRCQFSIHNKGSLKQQADSRSYDETVLSLRRWPSSTLKTVLLKLSLVNPRTSQSLSVRGAQRRRPPRRVWEKSVYVRAARGSCRWMLLLLLRGCKGEGAVKVAQVDFVVGVGNAICAGINSCRGVGEAGTSPTLTFLTLSLSSQVFPTSPLPCLRRSRLLRFSAHRPSNSSLVSRARLWSDVPNVTSLPEGFFCTILPLSLLSASLSRIRWVTSRNVGFCLQPDSSESTSAMWSGNCQRWIKKKTCRILTRK